MPGRKFNTGNYRFGFNGKENDREWGDQLIQDYGFRLYNPSIGRFLSEDPLSYSYAFYTPYQFAGNKPINCIDIDGLEDLEVITQKKETTKTKIKIESNTAKRTRIPSKLSPNTPRARNPFRITPKGGTLQTILIEAGVELTVYMVTEIYEGEQEMAERERSMNEEAETHLKAQIEAGTLYKPKWLREMDKQIEEQEGNITLYRGIRGTDYRFEGGEITECGFMRPWGYDQNQKLQDDAHSSAVIHNRGRYEDDTYSIFTSWTTDPEVALKHSKMGVKGKRSKKTYVPGIVLTKTFKKSELVKSPDAFQEKEKLVKGVVKDYDTKTPEEFEESIKTN